MFVAAEFRVRVGEFGVYVRRILLSLLPRFSNRDFAASSVPGRRITHSRGRRSVLIWLLLAPRTDLASQLAR